MTFFLRFFAERKGTRGVMLLSSIAMRHLLSGCEVIGCHVVLEYARQFHCHKIDYFSVAKEI